MTRLVPTFASLGLQDEMIAVRAEGDRLQIPAGIAREGLTLLEVEIDA